MQKIKNTAILFSLFVLSSVNTPSANAHSANNTDISQKKILYIGDSHSSGQFGIRMYEYLSKLSSNTTLMSSCGSTPKSWLSTKQYQKTVCGFWHKDALTDTRSTELQTPNYINLLEHYSPDISVIQLGTNMAAFDNPQIFEKSINTIMQATVQAGSLCIWIGAPKAKSKRIQNKNIQATDALLAQLAEKNSCYFIKSSDITDYPTANRLDGIHYPKLASNLWADKVIKRLAPLIE